MSASVKKKGMVRRERKVTCLYSMYRYIRTYTIVIWNRRRGVAVVDNVVKVYVYVLCGSTIPEAFFRQVPPCLIKEHDSAIH